jgi:hypothetical protein
MDYPEISEKVIDRLYELGFEGLDANMRTSLFEYCGCYSPQHEVALLVEPLECGTRGDPRVSIQHIRRREIRHEIEHAGPGFQSFTCNSLPPDTDSYMDVIQSMHMYNGGWHQNSHLWRNLSNWDEEELLRVLNFACEANAG